MAQRMSYGKVVLGGLLAGAVLGVSQGLLHDNVWVGLVMGVLGGTVLAAGLRRSLGSTALRGLDRGRRRAVSRAMRRGEPVEDPRLARPLVDQVDAVLATPFPVKTMRVVFALLCLLGLVVMVLGFADEGAAGLLGGSPLVVISLLMVFVVLPLGQRQRERIRRSQEATRERHLTSSGDDR
ncbi:hypothetical protein IOD16_17285 [Saccharothrix sp. 6-C]|uniref:hypothetical protein n=1 Tax=Saccharothrix sp. 6-C TaxID=2781735 RepID=UPI0019175D34|nr:hypothetical protein [Saccharothrix sp. 6-C]QQQ79986.1 hypothetical protein IOD16_17285 [Saccharothrix sp. 6-C]